MRNLVICAALLTTALAAAEDSRSGKKHPVYLSFFIHCEASPIRGVPVDVQTEPYSGEGVLPRNQYLDKILDVCERYGIKFEFAVTPIFAQQLREDRPDIIQRIKRMKLPISRYPSIAGHVLPAPVGDMRHMPGMLLQQLRNREIDWDEYIRQEWTAETRTLVPAWRLKGDRVIVDNPHRGTPMKLDDLPRYRIPREDRRLYGGALALAEVFGVTPLPVFPPIFQGDQVEPRRLTPVLKALGMMSFEPSTHPFQAFSAPIRATDPKMVSWFVKHFPVDKPLHADSGFGYTHDYVGKHVGLNVNEDIIRYAVEHPDEYRIVWPDPEGRQWTPENSPEEFFKRTYGVSSLKEVREMAPPVRKVREIDPSIPIREVSRERPSKGEGWRDKLLYALSELGVSSETTLPDFLRPVKHWVSGEQVRAAAQSIVDDTEF
ncbi:MAG: hypothetical protein GY953_39815, partial [bacterium]|nr:hypothetical protein [bacterium]